MVRKGIFLAGILMLALAGGSPAGATQNKSITVINKAKTTFFHLFIAPADSSQWETDYLDNILEPGDSLLLEVSLDPKTRRWNLRVEDSEGQELIWKDVELGRKKKVALHHQDGRTWTE